MTTKTKHLHIDSVRWGDNMVHVCAVVGGKDADYSFSKKLFEKYVDVECGLLWALGEDSGRFTWTQFYNHPARVGEYLEKYIIANHIK